MTKNKKQNKLNIYTHLLSFCLGLLAFYLTQEISSYINRAKVNIEIKSIVIYETFDKQWNIDFNIRLLNSGNNKGIIKINNSNIFLGSLSHKSFEFKIDSIFSVDSKISYSKTISAKFPLVLKSIDFENIPKVYKIDLSVDDIINDEQLSFSIDSNRVLYSSVFETGYREAKLMKDVQIDSSKNQIRFITKPFYIDYKGTSYLNKVYPKNVNVEYSVIGDRIKIGYSLPLGDIKLGTATDVMDGIMFFPHPFLKDKIDHPNKNYLLINVENKEKTKNLYEDYKIGIHSPGRNYFYIIK